MNLSLTTKVFLGFAVVLLTFGAVSISNVVQMRRIGEEIRLVGEGYLPLIRSVAYVDSALKSLQWQREKVPSLARLYGCPKEPIQNARQLAASTIAKAPESERGFLRNLDQKFAELEAKCVEHEKASADLFESMGAGEGGEKVASRRERVRDIETRMESDIKTAAAWLDQRVRQRVLTAERSQARGALTVVALSLFAVLVGLAATALAGRALAPIRQLTEGVSRISRGDYNAQVPMSSSDEIGILAREFNAMAASLRARERELTEKQQALVRAERLAAIGRVTAQITHEIRNPLSSIGLNAEMLEEALASEAPSSQPASEVRELLAAISREVDRLTEITEHYLRFARLPKPVLEAWDVNEIVASVLDFCSEENVRAGVEVVRHLGAGLPQVLADEGQVRQALLNLLRNAREAMPTGGTLTVETGKPAGDGEGTQVEIRVSDTGPGIPAADLARLFDPFFSTKERGTGLGLAVTQQIAVEHGGGIRCESAPGRGTTFVLSLRAAASTPASAGTVERAAPAGPAL